MARPIDIELNDNTPGIDATAERLRADVARRREQRDESTSEVVRQIDEAARLKAEEKAAREAAERARREAEAEARRLAEEAARRAAEEQARLAAAEEARCQAAAQAQRDEEEARRRAEEERRRKAAEKKARAEAREKARREEEERDRLAIQERLRRRREQRRRVVWPLALGVLLPLGLAFLFLQLYSFDGRRAEFDRIASEIFGVPVKTGSARLALFPSPQWRMSEVQLGSGADAVRIAHVGIGSSWPGLLGGALAFTSIDVDRPQLPPAVALKLLHQASDPVSLKAGEVRVSGLSFTGVPKDLPPLTLLARFQDGRLSAVSGQGEDAESGAIAFDLKRENAWQLNLNAAQLRWLLGPAVPLEGLALKATLGPDALQIREFAAGLYAGELSGDGRLSWQDGWQDGWRLSARLAARHIDAAKLARAWLREGSLAGDALLLAEAASAKELLPRAGLSGSFAVERGVLGGVDLDKVLQDRGIGEEFRFESLRGNLAVEGQRIELSGLDLLAADLKAGGTLNVDAARVVAGRLGIQARTGGARRTASLKIGGSLALPHYQR